MKNYNFFCPNRKLDLLRISIGLVYLWFGILKYFVNLYEIKVLSTEVIHTICFGLLSEDVCYIILAQIEVMLGLLLITNIFRKITIKLALLHMLGTFLPLIIRPESVYDGNFFNMTLVGQYIVKNLIIISSLLIIYPHDATNKGEEKNS